MIIDLIVGIRILKKKKKVYLYIRSGRHVYAVLTDKRDTAEKKMYRNFSISLALSHSALSNRTAIPLFRYFAIFPFSRLSFISIIPGGTCTRVVARTCLIEFSARNPTRSIRNGLETNGLPFSPLSLSLSIFFR